MRNRDDKESAFVKAARFLKYNKLVFILSVIAAAMLVFSVFADKGLLTRLKYQSEKKKLEKQFDDEKKKQEDLKKEIDELNNSNEKIEKIAREKYGMTREGEQIFKIEVDSTK
ncbi:MAG: septum formation initiator family protein [Bacteroidetes bacterium]|nr:septum formation initiator family protein [Bacteroidota bacterium]